MNIFVPCHSLNITYSLFIDYSFPAQALESEEYDFVFHGLGFV